MSPASYEFSHAPVLLFETIAGLKLRPEGVYVDCTVGGGGHSAAIYRQLAGKGRLIAVDRDRQALEAAGTLLKGIRQQQKDAASLDMVHSSFAALPEILAELEITHVDGILADLGVSSPQLDQPERGFSYQMDGPLDMRMDQSTGQTAAELVNTLSAAELQGVLADFGEERYAARIAAAIVKRRADKPFTSTADLAAVIAAAQPAKARREAQHPAKRSFQALRIAVNDELGQLENWLEAACAALLPGGRLAVISFHSLEDRPVKMAYRRWEDPCICPPSLPHVCGREPLGRAIERGGQTASAEELQKNPRARSARLRVFERNLEPYFDSRIDSTDKRGK